MLLHQKTNPSDALMILHFVFGVCTSGIDQNPKNKKSPKEAFLLKLAIDKKENTAGSWHYAVDTITMRNGGFMLTSILWRFHAHLVLWGKKSCGNCCTQKMRTESILLYFMCIHLWKIPLHTHNKGIPCGLQRIQM